MSYDGSVETMYVDPVSFVPNQRCSVLSLMGLN